VLYGYPSQDIAALADRLSEWYTTIATACLLTFAISPLSSRTSGPATNDYSRTSPHSLTHYIRDHSKSGREPIIPVERSPIDHHSTGPSTTRQHHPKGPRCDHLIGRSWSSVRTLKGLSVAAPSTIRSNGWNRRWSIQEKSYKES